MGCPDPGALRSGEDAAEDESEYCTDTSCACETSEVGEESKTDGRLYAPGDCESLVEIDGR